MNHKDTKAQRKEKTLCLCALVVKGKTMDRDDKPMNTDWHWMEYRVVVFGNPKRNRSFLTLTEAEDYIVDVRAEVPKRTIEIRRVETKILQTRKGA